MQWQVCGRIRERRERSQQERRAAAWQQRQQRRVAAGVRKVSKRMADRI